MRPVVIAVLLAVSQRDGHAQPKAVELFATSGYLTFRQDTGFEGGAAAFGATAVLPVTAHLAVEAGAQTARIDLEDKFRVNPNYATRLTLIHIVPVLRLGSERFHGFGGLGIAAAVTGRYGGGFLLGRGGVVVGLTRHLVLRGDFALGQLHSQIGSAGVGLGYRF